MTCKHLFKAVALALSLAVGAAPALAKNFTELKAAASPARRRVVRRHGRDGQSHFHHVSRA